MRRAYIISGIVVGVILFLVVSAILARAFNVGDVEQAALTSLVKAEASGDRSAVISDIDGCSRSPACLTRATAVTAALRHPGSVSVLQIEPSAEFSLGSTLGTARIAWLAGGSLPKVQCVRVRHAGNVLSGFRVELLEVSTQIPGGSDCPNHF